MSAKQTILISFALVAALCLASACSLKDDAAVETCAKSFGQNYFNLRLQQASGLCTDRSYKWIEFYASNISQGDVDVLNAQTDSALCDIDDIDIDGDSARVKMTVRNFLLCDSIGRPGRMCKQGKCRLTLRKEGETWKVDLDGPVTKTEE
ncbi:MAG: hypothetical protein U0K29_04495 [Prevotella sp.]|nr:hypothetical protein [Prevotella sp.]